jgi:hypothetical protein
MRVALVRTEEVNGFMTYVGGNIASNGLAKGGVGEMFLT